MKNKIKGLIGMLTSSVVKNIFGAFILFILFFLTVIICLEPMENIWNRVMVLCYMILTILYFIIVGTPNSEKCVGFGKINVYSFVLWCVIFPIICGILLTLVINKVFPGQDVDDIGFWSMAIFVAMSSFAWFLPKIFNHIDYTSRLDLYSTLWIALVTVITTSFDLQEKRGTFVLLLGAFLGLQLLIKYQICRKQERKDD